MIDPRNTPQMYADGKAAYMGERRLGLEWIARKMRDLIDPTDLHNGASAKLLMSRARDFFFTENDNLDTACLLAGVEPDAVRSAAMVYMQKHDPRSNHTRH
jgi:hypothetical protein